MGLSGPELHEKKGDEENGSVRVVLIEGSV